MNATWLPVCGSFCACLDEEHASRVTSHARAEAAILRSTGDEFGHTRRLGRTKGRSWAGWPHRGVVEVLGGAATQSTGMRGWSGRRSGHRQ
eukprot:6194922-Pleurochrysis_carterae.AAC.2